MKHNRTTTSTLRRLRLRFLLSKSREIRALAVAIQKRETESVLTMDQ